jgi:hypothetical protein
MNLLLKWPLVNVLMVILLDEGHCLEINQAFP